MIKKEEKEEWEEKLIVFLPKGDCKKVVPGEGAGDKNRKKTSHNHDKQKRNNH